MPREGLKPITTRFAGKCADCGREIKEGWNVLFDPETKKMYCRPCANKTFVGGDTSSLPKEVFDKLSPEAQEEIRLLGLTPPLTTTEQLVSLRLIVDTMAEDIVAIVGDVKLISGVVAEISSKQQKIDKETKAN